MDVISHLIFPTSLGDFITQIFSAYQVVGLILPFLLAYGTWRMWMDYIQIHYQHKQEWHLLEIKLPKEVTKSPQAMEIVIGVMHQTSNGNIIDRYIKGKVRDWFCLEIVSIGGTLHFYIRTIKKYKNLIQSQLYSQYPDVEVHDAEDYTRNVPYGMAGSNWEMWGREFQFTKDDAYPIKTYVDYGMDRDPKEEYKIDPMTPMIEVLGSIPPDQQIWIQIPIVASRARKPKPGTWFGKQDWRADGEALVKKLMKRDKPAENVFSPKVQLSPGEKVVVEAVERGLSKYSFDCGIRALYLAPKDTYDKNNRSAITGSLKQYGSLNLNGFKSYKVTQIEYPWQDFRKIRLNRKKRRMFDWYVRRAYFYVPVIHKTMGMNTEELATMFHLPGQVATTPTLVRVESKRSEPPPNLPV